MGNEEGILLEESEEEVLGRLEFCADGLGVILLATGSRLHRAALDLWGRCEVDRRDEQSAEPEQIGWVLVARTVPTAKYKVLLST